MLPAGGCLLLLLLLLMNKSYAAIYTYTYALFVLLLCHHAHMARAGTILTGVSALLESRNHGMCSNWRCVCVAY